MIEATAAPDWLPVEFWLWFFSPEIAFAVVIIIIIGLCLAFRR